MRDRVILRLLPVVLAASALLAVGPRASADPEAVLTNMRVPLSGVLAVTLPDGGEDLVTLAGPLHIVVRVVPPNPVIPTDPCRCEVFANAQGIDGTGASGAGRSGRRYQMVGAYDTVASPVDPCQKYRASLVFRIQSSGGDVSVAQRVALDLTLDANLAVSSAAAAFTGPGDVDSP